MINNKDLLKDLKTEMKKLDFKIKHPKIINGKTRAKKILLTAGMILAVSIPTMVSATGAILATDALNMDIVKLNTIPVNEVVETVNTSNGYFMEERTFVWSHDLKNELSFSTGWQLNESNNYERYETFFNISHIDLSKPEVIFAMDEEELKSKLKIIKKSKIEKSKLNADDEIYEADTIVVRYHYKDKNVTGEIEEPTERQIISILLYLAIVMAGTLVINKGIKLIFKEKPSDKIKERIDSYVYLSAKDIEELKELYRIKEQNYNLLVDGEEESGPSLKMMK